MAVVNSLPEVLADHLQSQNLSWFEVWKPLKAAVARKEKLERVGNVMIFGYDPVTELFTVATIFGEIEDAQLTQDDFVREVGKYTRGAPQC